MSGIKQSDVVYPRPVKVDDDTREALWRDLRAYGCYMVSHEVTPNGVVARRIAPGEVRVMR